MDATRGCHLPFVSWCSTEKREESCLSTGIADLHGKTPTQVTLRWLIQQPGVAAIPKASSAKHRAANFDVFSFELTDEEMERISRLGGDERLVDPPWAPDWDAK